MEKACEHTFEVKIVTWGANIDISDKQELRRKNYWQTLLERMREHTL